MDPIPDLARISEGTAKLEIMLDAVIAYVEGVSPPSHLKNILPTFISPLFVMILGHGR